MKIIFAVLFSVVFLMMCAACSFSKVLDETEISATIKELIYEETRGYCFVVLETDKDDTTLQFRVNEKFFDKADVGDEMKIVRKREKYLDGEKTNYYFQEQKLDFPFVNSLDGSVFVTIENMDIYFVSSGKYAKKAYKFTVKDNQNNEFTAYRVPYELWESLYEEQILCLRKEENTAKIKTYDYAYYLNEYLLFTV